MGDSGRKKKLSFLRRHCLFWQCTLWLKCCLQTAGDLNLCGGQSVTAILRRRVEPSWNVMAHADAREGKWRGKWLMGWVASTLHTTSEHGVSSITTADAHNSAASSRLNWPPLLPADLNGLVRFAERRNMVSAPVPSHFKRSVLWNVGWDS